MVVADDQGDADGDWNGDADDAGESLVMQMVVVTTMSTALIIMRLEGGGDDDGDAFEGVMTAFCSGIFRKKGKLVQSCFKEVRSRLSST